MRMHVLCVCVTGGKGVVTVIIIHVEVELLIHILAPLLMGLDVERETLQERPMTIP